MAKKAKKKGKKKPSVNIVKGYGSLLKALGGKKKKKKKK